VLAVLGGSSAFTPLLASALAGLAGEIPRLQVRLQGRDPSHLDPVARFCNLHASARGVDHAYQWTLSPAEAMEGADLVVNQVRVGGWEGRMLDETFPLPFGYPGDETIGPGGLLSALRSAGPVLELGRLAAARAGPGAFFLNMTNPLGVLTAGLGRIPGLRVFGLCELPQVVLEKALAAAGFPADGVEPDYLGVNHQGWFVRVFREGEDILPEILEALDREASLRICGVDLEVLLEWKALPLPYLRLYFHRERERRRLENRPRPRGEELRETARALYEAYAKREDPALPALLGKRKSPWIDKALAPAAASLLGGRRRTLYLSGVEDGGALGLDPPGPVERLCRVSARGPDALPFHEPAPYKGGLFDPILEFMEKILRFEEAALRAALSPGEETILEALLAHPWKIPLDKARTMAQAMVRIHPPGEGGVP